MYFNQYIDFYGGVAQLARAPALQAGGQEFDSLHLHHYPNIIVRIQHIEKYIDISNNKVNQKNQKAIQKGKLLNNLKNNARTVEKLKPRFSQAELLQNIN